MPKTRKIPGASLRRDGTPGRSVRLDPRAKLAAIAAMAVAVTLAPNMLCDLVLMGVAFAFGSIDNMLQHTDEIKGKLREKVENAVEDIKMSKFLATIRTDVPMQLDLDELKVEQPDETKLRAIFEELEFKTLINKFLNKGESKPMRAM